MTLRNQHNYVRFWTPIDGTYDDATSSLQMVAPDHSNSIKLGRNQTQHRTRAGSLQVYDRGIDYNNIMRLSFHDVRDSERSNLVSFLSAIQWGATRLAYEDMYGDVYYVRCATTSLEYTDTGLSVRNNVHGSEILWNFNFDLIDISDNTADLSLPDPPMNTALLLHLSDFNDPHAPESVTTIEVESNKVLETFLTKDWKVMHFLVCEEKAATKRNVKIVTIHCDGDLVSVAATLTDIAETPVTSLGGSPGVITYNASLDGAIWATQTLRLRASCTEAGWTIRARRMKLK